MKRGSGVVWTATQHFSFRECWDERGSLIHAPAAPWTSFAHQTNQIEIAGRLCPGGDLTPVHVTQHPPSFPEDLVLLPLARVSTRAPLLESLRINSRFLVGTTRPSPVAHPSAALPFSPRLRSLGHDRSKYTESFARPRARRPARGLIAGGFSFVRAGAGAGADLHGYTRRKRDQGERSLPHCT